jgi:hypothetical protein
MGADDQNVEAGRVTQPHRVNSKVRDEGAAVDGDAHGMK